MVSSTVHSGPPQALEALRFRPEGAWAWSPPAGTPAPGDLSHALSGPQLDLSEKWAGRRVHSVGVHSSGLGGGEGCAPRPCIFCRVPCAKCSQQDARAQLRDGVSQPRGRIYRLLHAQPWGPGWEPTWPELSRADPQRAGALCWLTADGQARARTGARGFFSPPGMG